MIRLAVIATHPTQNDTPWFRVLAQRPGLDLKVFYLWNFGVTAKWDRGFRQVIQWDVPLLDGYASEFVPNASNRPGTHHFRGIDNPSLMARLARYAPDAVMCLGYNFATFARLWLRWKSTRWPLLLYGVAHRLSPAKPPVEWSKRQVLSWIFRRFAAFLHIGAANKDYYLQHGVPEHKLFFTPFSVDHDRFRPSRKVLDEAREWKRSLGIPASHRVILFAGKFENKKRPQDLLAAFVRANIPNVSLLFVGSGALGEQLRRQAAGAATVFFAPFQNQALMPRTYAAGDIVVLPSQGSGETWGLCINEAMGLGRAVIVSNHVGCARDLVHHGRNGLVFPAGNVAALSQAITEAFVSPARLAEWGAESLEIIANYNYTRAAEGLERALASVVSQRAKPL